MKDFYIDKDGFKLHARLDLPGEEASGESAGTGISAVSGSVACGGKTACEEYAPASGSMAYGEYAAGVSRKDRVPLVIVVHGFTGHMEERHILAVSKAARDASMATLRVDMYGHGRSDGSFERHTIMDWVLELMYVVDYAKKLDFVSDIYLMGHSQGGLALMLAAGLMADRISGIIPLSPAISIRDGARKGELFGGTYDPDHIPDSLSIGSGRVISGDYIRIAKALPIEQAIDAYGGPVLIVHGTADESVPAVCSVRAAQRYRRAKFIPVEGDTHCYDRHLEQVTAAVREFLESMKAEEPRDKVLKHQEATGAHALTMSTLSSLCSTCFE